MSKVEPALESSHAAELTTGEKAAPVYPVIVNFLYRGMQRSESLRFEHPIPAPIRNDVVTLRFNDFGTPRRVSGLVTGVVREFYGPGTVVGVTVGLIIQITLGSIVDQAP